MSESLRKQAEAAIKVGLARSLPEYPHLDWDQALTGDIGLDSVQIMNLIMEVEDELDLSVPVDLLAEINTLKQLAERLAALMSKPS